MLSLEKRSRTFSPADSVAEASQPGWNFCLSFIGHSAHMTISKNTRRDEKQDAYSVKGQTTCVYAVFVCVTLVLLYKG